VKHFPCLARAGDNEDSLEQITDLNLCAVLQDNTLLSPLSSSFSPNLFLFFFFFFIFLPPSSMSISMSISTLSSSTFPNSNPSLTLSSQKFPLFPKPLLLPFSHPLSLPLRTPTFLSPLLCKSPEAEAEAPTPPPEDQWLQKLPEKSKPLYSHSLPCIEAWLRSLGFCQSKEDRALWLVHKPDWHAHLSLDVTDLYIRCLPLFYASFTSLLLQTIFDFSFFVVN